MTIENAKKAKGEKQTQEIVDPEIDMHGIDGEPSDQTYLQTHEEINRELCGELIKLERGYVELRLT
ncbi:MAG: hypothetical protein AB7D43_11785, partial [Sulfurimonadaceae bacterium]